MNTNMHTTQIPAATQSGRTAIHRNGKTTRRVPGTAVAAQAEPRAAQTAPRAATPAPAFIALEPAFIALADQFGMVPERLAERVISAFAATKPARIIVKARAFSPQASR